MLSSGGCCDDDDDDVVVVVVDAGLLAWLEVAAESDLLSLLTWLELLVVGALFTMSFNEQVAPSI